MEKWALQYKLVNSSPEYVFKWLEDNSDRIAFECRAELEEALLSRNNSLINLGLALHGIEQEVGYKLFCSADDTIKKAVLSGNTVQGVLVSGSWLKSEGIVAQLISEWNEDLLSALFNNPKIEDSMLCELFERKEPYTSIDDVKWMMLVFYASSNKRLKEHYDDTWIDGWGASSYNKVFTSAWWLFDRFPQTELAFNVLSRLSSTLIAERPSDMDVMKVIEKWKPQTEDENVGWSDLREALVRLIPTYSDMFKSLKDSDDVALRRGYYKNIAGPKLSDVNEGFKKDCKDFLDAALYNKAMYKNSEVREALSNACWEAPDEFSNMDYPNRFNVHCAHIAREYPEWFKDAYSGEVSFDGIEDYQKRVEKRIKSLGRQVLQIHNNLIGKTAEYNPFDDAHEGALSTIKSEISTIRTLVLKIQDSNPYTWFRWITLLIIALAILSKLT